MSRISGAAIIVAALLAGTVLSPHAARGAGEPARLSIGQCFHESDVSGWRAADPKTIYLRVFTSRYYRVDLSRMCSALRWPDARLITHVHGGDLICAPVDFDLRASERPGAIPEPCFVQSVTALSPEEAASLPGKLKP